MIPRSFISQLVARCDIEEIVSSYITLKRAGRNVKGLCPFHSEKTPSFVIYPDNQSFYCFGCGAGGDVISFIMRAENLEYPDAVRFLARRAGMDVPEDGDTDSGRLRTRILEINRESALFFHKCLKSPAGKAGYEYLHEKRQLPDSIITAYGLGYAPDSWDSLKKHLLKKGYAEQEMLAACVIAKGRSGHTYDQFRNRVMFPIIDLRGSVIAFGGRVLDDSKPKYLNSPDTPVFKKSRNLFSLNFAKNAGKDRLILAEGYMDVIAIHAAGFHNVVATLGTSLTEEQARLMSKYAKEIVIAYDSDGAGRAATQRAVGLLSDAGLTSKVLEMEGAKDPDEFIKKFGSTRFEMLLDGAANVTEHGLNRLKQECDLDTAEGKIEYLRRAVTLLAEVKNPLEREVYAGYVARDAGVMPEAVISQVGIALKRRAREKERREWRAIESGRETASDRINPEKSQNLKQAVAEEGILAFLLKNPDQYGEISGRISPGDFVTSYNRKIFETMLRIHKEGSDVTLTTLGSELTADELRGVAGIQAKSHDRTITKEMFDAYIDILLEHKNRPNPKDVGALDADALEEYRKQLLRKK